MFSLALIGRLCAYVVVLCIFHSFLKPEKVPTECEQFLYQIENYRKIDRNFNLIDCKIFPSSYGFKNNNETLIVDGGGHSIFSAVPFLIPEGHYGVIFKNITLFYSKSTSFIPILKESIRFIEYEAAHSVWTVE